MSDFIIENGILTQYTGAGGNVIIPKGVRAIGEGAFIGSRAVTGVIIPNGVQSIGARAFFQRKVLKNISIPDSVTFIGECAFKDCFGLQTATIGKGITELPPLLFASCSSLTDVAITGNVTRIGAEAFKQCLRLKNITIPDSVTYIGNNAFSECYQLKSFPLPKSITQVESGAIPFYIPLTLSSDLPQNDEQAQMILKRFGISRLPLSFLFALTESNPELRKKLTAKPFRTKQFPALIKNENPEDFKKLLSLIPKMPADEIDLYLEQSVDNNTVEITNMLILYKNKLYSTEKIFEMQNVEMEKALGIREKTLTDYRKYFKIGKDNDQYIIKGYKSNLDTITIPGNIVGIPVTIGENAFYEAQVLRTVYIENGVTDIGRCAFEKCYYLENIEIPDSVRYIGNCAFYECFHLQDIVIPGSVARIGAWAFYKCNHLKNVTIENGVQCIGNCTFHSCFDLQTITIPESVTEIDNTTFYDCKKVTICAPKGSYAEAYAKRKNINFQEI